MDTVNKIYKDMMVLMVFQKIEDVKKIYEMLLKGYEFC